MKAKPLLQRIRLLVKPLTLDLFLVAGYVSLVYGCASHYRPLGFAIGGILLLAYVWLCRRTDRSEDDVS